MPTDSALNGSAPIDRRPIDGTRMKSEKEAAAIAAASFPPSVISFIP
jgi:hypothetical protein